MAGVARRRGIASRPEPPTSPYDAQAALEHLLARLRASAGATRVAVWVHEASTDTLVLYRTSVCASSATENGAVDPAAIARSRSPFLSAVVGTGRPVVARADGRRAPDRELLERGLTSAHGEPLFRDGEVVGVLTVEPAAAASPQLLRTAAPKLALALSEAWARHSEGERTARSEVLLGLIESAARAESLDELLGSACRQLAELGEVERASILLQDGGLVPADRPTNSLTVPLGRPSNLVGVLTLDSSRPHPFSEDMRRFAAAAGAYLGGVIEQALARSGGDRSPDPAVSSASARPRVPRPRRALAPRTF